MRNKRQKKKELSDEQLEIVEAKGFFDRTMPGVIRFYTDHYICGNFYKSCWAVTEYPPSTEETAILAHLADRNGVTLRIYNRLVTSMEQRKIVQQAMRKNHMMTTTNDVNESIKAQNNIDDVVELLSEIRRNKEPLLHTAVFLELKASSEDKLKELQADVQMELTRSKISVDRLLLRQKEGFLSVHPAGNNVFASQFERVLPASSVADLYPLNYSGKTDKNGFYIGRDKYGSNVLVDFDRRTEDKTNSNILILGNSGQGKSYLMKLLLCNQREAGKSVLVLDPEHEYEDLCSNLGGTYIDMMSGEFMINPLEPKEWSENSRFGNQEKETDDSPETFRKVTRLSQHISYLKDFFRAYKDFTDAEIDTIEIMLMKLYARFGIDDLTDLDKLENCDYPVMSDLYELVEKEFMAFDNAKKHLYTEEILQNICLGLHSMCKGAESKYFNGRTNIKDSEFICFGVKGLMDTNKRLKDTLLFNILSYMSNQLLGRGNTVAAVDELYLFLTNMTAIEYIRNGMKRVRKKESSFILASQNIEDFLLPEIKEFTKPLFSIPSHHFLFNPGNISARRVCGSFERSEKWSQKARFEFFMESKNRRSAENSERSGICDDVKVKFPLYVFPETMQKIDMLYEADNCKSKTEFIEKAIRFYCGYLLNKDSVAAEYAAPQITAITEGIVKGTEQRLSRALFKVAVELGAVSHMLAAINDIDDETMVKLRAMCTDEVRRINGVINFERAVRYQRN